MGIIGNYVVMGFGDVGISANLKGTVFDPTVKIKFYQLDSAHYDPDLANADKSVTPVTIVSDIRSLEILHNLTGQLLQAVYDQQLIELNHKKDCLQAQVS